MGALRSHQWNIMSGKVRPADRDANDSRAWRARTTWRPRKPEPRKTMTSVDARTTAARRRPTCRRPVLGNPESHYDMDYCGLLSAN